MNSLEENKMDEAQKRLNEIRADWRYSREHALKHAERLANVTRRIQDIYAKHDPDLGDLVDLRNNLDIFDSSLDEQFPSMFYNLFVSKWLYNFDGKE